MNGTLRFRMIADSAGFGWLCLSTVRRAKLFAGMPAGGAVALGGVAVGGRYGVASRS